MRSGSYIKSLGERVFLLSKYIGTNFQEVSPKVLFPWTIP